MAGAEPMPAPTEEPFMSHRKPLIVALVALAGALGAGAAHAGDVHWSIGVNLPVHPNVSVGVSSAPPVVYEAPRVYYPRVVAPAPRVVYVPQPVYVQRPVPVYGPPVYVHDRWHRHGDRWDRRDDRWDRKHDRWDRRDRWRDGWRDRDGRRD
jgi:hypothetical protein